MGTWANWYETGHDLWPAYHGTGRIAIHTRSTNSVLSVVPAGVVRHWHWPVPVSYTHLRAHETVLDLVCRLLLEKKQELIVCCLYMNHHQ